MLMESSVRVLAKSVHEQCRLFGNYIKVERGCILCECV